MNSIDRTRNSWFESNPKKTSLILILIVVAIAELLTRLFFPPNLVERKTVVPNDSYFKNYLSDIEFITYPSKHDGFEPVSNKINSIGIRGPELEKKNKYRVLNIGDSFVQADEVSFEDTFGEKLNDSNLNIEFISHGIASWSPTPEFSWIYHNVETIEFDEVNLFLCVNDFFRQGAYANVDEFYRAYAKYSQDGIPLYYDIGSFQKQSILTEAKEYFYILKLAAFLKVTVTKAFAKSDGSNYAVNVPNEILMLSGDSESWDHELKINVLETLGVVNSINAFLSDKNIKLNVLFVPLGLAWEDEFGSGKIALSDNWDRSKVISQEGIEKFTKNYLESLDITYIDLAEQFYEYKKDNKGITLFYDMDGHWTKRGHHLVHEILYWHYERTGNGARMGQREE